MRLTIEKSVALLFIGIALLVTAGFLWAAIPSARIVAVATVIIGWVVGGLGVVSVAHQLRRSARPPS